MATNLIEFEIIEDVSVIAEFLKTHVNWQKFVNLCASLGSQFNDAQWRFLKAFVFETAVEKFSEGLVQYVAQEGCDFIIPSINNVKIEMKYTEDVLYTAKSSVPRKQTKTITLLNSKGTNTHSVLPETYADFLLVVGQRGAALIDKPTLANYIEIKGDSITTTIPTDKMHFIFTPDTISEPKVIEFNLRQQIIQTIRTSLSEF